MTELTYLYDSIGHAEAMAEEDARIAEAIGAHDERARRAAEEEAARSAQIADIQRLAQDGLERVAEKNEKVDTKKTLGMISLRHATGHNRTLPI